jgi:hypothetical protein
LHDDNPYLFAIAPARSMVYFKLARLLMRGKPYAYDRSVGKKRQAAR